MKYNIIKHVTIFLISIIIGVILMACLQPPLSKNAHGAEASKSPENIDSHLADKFKTDDLLRMITTELNILDAEILAGNWAQVASSADIEKVLSVLSGPAKSERDGLAKMIASAWAKKDPDAAMKYVMSREIDGDIAFQVGDTWACFSPENSARWLRNQPDLTKKECAGIVCGLAKVHPEGALEFLSREGVMHYEDLELISSAALTFYPDYFTDWIKSIFNQNNQKEILYAQINFFSDLSAEKLANILSEIPDFIFLKEYTKSIYQNLVRNKLNGKAVELLQQMPMDIVSEILPELLYSDQYNSDIKDIISELPPENRQLAILHYIEHNFSSKDEYIEALDILVFDPAEKNVILKMLNNINFTESENPRTDQ